MTFKQYSESFDELSFIMDYEAGVLDDDEVAEGFQHLVDNGHAWTLQGSYGRMAAALLDAGVIRPRAN
jgi:hypothetical protein